MTRNDERQRADVIDNEIWSWECIGDNQGAVFLGVWQARAYVTERSDGWYAAGEGQKAGPDYVYRLPGGAAPRGPYSRASAERIARQMIGLAADASRPDPRQLVLYQPQSGPGWHENEAQEITGGRWMLSANGIAHSCEICAAVITSGWSDGPWKQARRFVCSTHVLIYPEDRPGRSLRAAARGGQKAPPVSSGD